MNYYCEYFITKNYYLERKYTSSNSNIRYIINTNIINNGSVPYIYLSTHGLCNDAVRSLDCMLR